MHRLVSEGRFYAKAEDIAAVMSEQCGNENNHARRNDNAAQELRAFVNDNIKEVCRCSPSLRSAL